jgi:Cys-tRNA(Pro)/Cys-tRNA(Cys) deacylase
MSHEQIRDTLQSHGVPFTFHTHAPLRTVQDYLGHFPLEQMLKTVAFQVKDGPWVLVALRGADQVSYRRLADALGVRRAALAQPSAAEVEAALGVPPGGVSPIPPRPDVRVLFDQAALDLDTVYCGAGRPDRTLEIRLPDLLRVVQPQVAAVAQEAPAPPPEMRD